MEDDSTLEGQERGHHDGSGDKPENNPQNPHGGRGEPTLRSCPYAHWHISMHTCMYVYVCVHTHTINIYINKSDFKTLRKGILVCATTYIDVILRE